MRFRLAPVAALAAMVAALGTGILPAAAGIAFDVAIQKSHTGNFTVGQNGTFTIMLTNALGSASTGGTIFTVTDTLPTGLTYQSFAPGTSGFSCSAVSQVVTCTGAPNLTAGASKSFTITVAVGAQAAPSVSNTASFTESCICDSNAANNTSTDPVTVNAAPSPSPTPSTSPSPTAVALPATGTGTGTGTATPVALLGLLAVVAAGAIAAVVRKRAARPRS